jgi:hypothetical protein
LLHAHHQARWRDFERQTTQLIQDSPRSLDETPVPAGWTTAIVYARTHAPIELGPFRSWLEMKTKEAEQFAAGLERLRNELSRRNPSASIFRPGR